MGEGERAGGWASDDPRYRGYRATRRGPRLDHRVALALDLVPSWPGAVLADVGAGDAVVTALATTRASGALGVAIDVGFPPPLDHALDRGTRVRGDVVALPLASRSVDVVVSLEVIEHLADPDALLEEARRVLRPAGVLVLSTPRLDSLLVVGSLLAGLQPPGVDASVRARFGNALGEGRPSGHLHLFTKRALTEMLNAHGFHIEVVRQGRFSSSWRQARSGRRRRARDWMLEAAFVLYDLVPVRKDVLVVRARLSP